MSDNKKYYWLKLNDDFFEDDTIEWIEEQENGERYVLFYLKLCLKSLKEEGTLVRYVGEKIMPYDVKALAKLTNTDQDTVAVALKVFEEIGLIERQDTGEIFMKQINELIGSETDAAKRVRKHRARQKMLQSNGKTLQRNMTVQKCNTEIEIEKDIEIEIESKKKPPKRKYAEFISLTEEEHEKLTAKFGKEDTDALIEILDNYKGSTGKKYKSDYRAILSWVVDKLSENKLKKVKKPPEEKVSWKSGPASPDKFKNFYVS